MEPVGLAVLLVPVDTEPAKTAVDGIDQFRLAAVSVCVLDPQHKHAAGFAGVHPVKERRPGATDVEVSGWGR